MKFKKPVADEATRKKLQDAMKKLKNTGKAPFVSKKDRESDEKQDT